MEGYLEKGIQTPMAKGRSSKIVSMMKWIRTSRLSIKNSLFLGRARLGTELIDIRGPSSAANFSISSHGLVYEEVVPLSSNANDKP